MNKHLLALAAMAATGTSFAASKVHATASNQPQLQNIEGVKLGEKPAAKDGTKKNGKNTVSITAKELGAKAQATAKQAIGEANSFAKATVGKADAKFGLAKAGKPVADITHRESGLGTYTAPVFKTPAKSKGLGSYGARAVGAHAA